MTRTAIRNYTHPAWEADPEDVVLEITDDAVHLTTPPAYLPADAYLGHITREQALHGDVTWQADSAAEDGVETFKTRKAALRHLLDAYAKARHEETTATLESLPNRLILPPLPEQAPPETPAQDRQEDRDLRELFQEQDPAYEAEVEDVHPDGPFYRLTDEEDAAPVRPWTPGDGSTPEFNENGSLRAPDPQDEPAATRPDPRIHRIVLDGVGYPVEVDYHGEVRARTDNRFLGHVRLTRTPDNGSPAVTGEFRDGTPLPLHTDMENALTTLLRLDREPKTDDPAGIRNPLVAERMLAAATDQRRATGGPSIDPFRVHVRRRAETGDPMVDGLQGDFNVSDRGVVLDGLRRPVGYLAGLRHLDGSGYWRTTTHEHYPLSGHATRKEALRELFKLAEEDQLEILPPIRAAAPSARALAIAEDQARRNRADLSRPDRTRRFVETATLNDRRRGRADRRSQSAAEARRDFKDALDDYRTALEGLERARLVGSRRDVESAEAGLEAALEELCAYVR